MTYLGFRSQQEVPSASLHRDAGARADRKQASTATTQAPDPPRGIEAPAARGSKNVLEGKAQIECHS